MDDAVIDPCPAPTSEVGPDDERGDDGVRAFLTQYFAGRSAEPRVPEVLQAARASDVSPDDVWRELFRQISAGELSLDWTGKLVKKTS